MRARHGAGGFARLLTKFNLDARYDYKGARDLESLSAFAKGGFKEKESVPVPGEPTFFDLIKREVMTVWKQLVTNKKDRNKTVAVFAVGILVGAVLATSIGVVCFFAGSGEAKQKSE